MLPRPLVEQTYIAHWYISSRAKVDRLMYTDVTCHCLNLVIGVLQTGLAVCVYFVGNLNKITN